MYLFNETIGIDKSAEQEWLIWMKEKHMPAVMKTNMFVSSKIYRVLHDNEDETISYSVQYFAETIDHVQQYLEVFAPKILEEFHTKFKDRHVAFRTLLMEI